MLAMPCDTWTKFNQRFGKTSRSSAQVHVGREKLSRIHFVTCDMKWSRLALRSVRVKLLTFMMHATCPDEHSHMKISLFATMWTG